MFKLIMAAGLVCVVALTGLRIRQARSVEAVYEPKVRPVANVAVCPWREPEADLKRFFPDATSERPEIRILSGQRLELAGKLGRELNSDENSLTIHQVFQEQTLLGCVMTRRVKGTFGGIEIVVAVNCSGRVRGLRIQSQREPEAVGAALEDARWLGAFEGKGAQDPMKLGVDIPDVPAKARGSAEAIVDGTRSLLILLAAAGESLVQHIH